MRITCPNCGAQYEVQDALIPSEGRDVQCSACSATWFQPGPGAVAQEASMPVAETAGGDFNRSLDAETGSRAEADAPIAAADADESAPSAAAGPHPAGMGTDTQVVGANAPVQDANNDAAPSSPDATGTGRGRGLDPSVRDILRSEAEREARLRQAGATPVETQAEMTLDAAPRDAERRAALAPSDERREPPASRRDLLPDIEEITSTLRARPPHGADMAEAEPAPPSEEAVRRRGVRIGFFSTLVLAALAAWVYANADLVAEGVPQAAPALEAFTGRVDAGRFWLDNLALRLAENDAGS